MKYFGTTALIIGLMMITLTSSPSVAEEAKKLVGLKAQPDITVVEVFSVQRQTGRQNTRPVRGQLIGLYPELERDQKPPAKGMVAVSIQKERWDVKSQKQIPYTTYGWVYKMQLEPKPPAKAAEKPTCCDSRYATQTNQLLRDITMKLLEKESKPVTYQSGWPRNYYYGGSYYPYTYYYHPSRGYWGSTYYYGSGYYRRGILGLGGFLGL